jgi:NMD protein affecting ribosome stability and mRNA decay
MTPREFTSKPVETTTKEKVPHIHRKDQYYTDPYLTDAPPDEVSICKECRSVYANGRWELESQANRDLENAKHVSETLCPACRKIRDRMPGGVVTLSGSFLKNHEDEIVNLVNHENQSAMEINPLERIMDIQKRDSEITVLTTNEKLAQRIGRSVFKAYSGEVEYKWSKGTKLARVNWHRD